MNWLVIILFSAPALAAKPYLRLPVQSGEAWYITCAYTGTGDCYTHGSGSPDAYALDFNQPGSNDFGKPVFAAASGIVIATCYSCGGYGNYVDIDHGDGYVTRYAHLNTINTSGGWRHNQGDQVGTIGSTGTSSPHLRFRLTRNGAAEIPEPMSCYTGFTPNSGPYYSDNILFVWNFNNGGTVCTNGKDGWRAEGINANAVISPGIWILDPASWDADPKTYSQPYCCVDPYTYGYYINPTVYRAVEIRIASNAQNRKLKAYFRTTNQNYYSEAKHEEINIPGSGGYYTCIVQMGYNGYWYSGGRVTQLRIDPTEYGNPDGSYDNIGIDYIKLTTYSGGSYCQ